jgi:hypothetical protein
VRLEFLVLEVKKLDRDLVQREKVVLNNFLVLQRQNFFIFPFFRKILNQPLIP